MIEGPEFWLDWWVSFVSLITALVFSFMGEKKKKKERKKKEFNGTLLSGICFLLFSRHSCVPLCTSYCFSAQSLTMILLSLPFLD